MTGNIPNEGSIITQTIYKNESLIKDFNAKFVFALPFILGTSISKEKLAGLRKRFLKNTPTSQWVTKNNYAEITKVNRNWKMNLNIKLLNVFKTSSLSIAVFGSLFPVPDGKEHQATPR